MLNNSKIFGLAGLMLVGILIFSGCKNSGSTVKVEKDFTLSDVDGKTHKLSDYAGKKVYIKFWATWCSVCLAGIEDLESFNKQKDKDTVVLTVVSPGTRGEKNSKDFISWFKKQGYEFTVLLDEDANIARDYGVRAYPTSVYIDSQGKISKTQIGHVSNMEISKTIMGIV